MTTRSIAWTGLLLLPLVALGCGGDTVTKPKTSPTPNPTPTPTPTPIPTPTPTPYPTPDAAVVPVTPDAAAPGPDVGVGNAIDAAPAVDAMVCTVMCAPGLKRCGPSGGLQECKTDPSTMCPYWAAELTCGPHADCTPKGMSAECLCKPA